jgi:hypothetical protein
VCACACATVTGACVVSERVDLQVNVVFFTYRDFTNHTYVSATTRGRVFFDDSVFGNIRSAVYRIIARWFDKTEQVLPLYRNISFFLKKERKVK